mmetsp:Transcript_4147/g.10718  ORF Transcript_4147/g.10718 Transcript_4147/m.10718 type:complete len:146 (+) Transcript_4147:476-913(+)
MHTSIIHPPMPGGRQDRVLLVILRPHDGCRGGSVWCAVDSTCVTDRSIDEWSMYTYAGCTDKHKREPCLDHSDGGCLAGYTYARMCGCGLRVCAMRIRVRVDGLMWTSTQVWRPDMPLFVIATHTPTHRGLGPLITTGASYRQTG